MAGKPTLALSWGMTGLPETLCPSAQLTRIPASTSFYPYDRSLQPEFWDLNSDPALSPNSTLYFIQSQFLNLFYLLCLTSPHPPYSFHCLPPFFTFSFPRWTIKARVTSKSDIRRWSNAKGEGHLFSMDLMDSAGKYGQSNRTVLQRMILKNANCVTIISQSRKQNIILNSTALCSKVRRLLRQNYFT